MNQSEVRLLGADLNTPRLHRRRQQQPLLGRLLDVVAQGIGTGGFIAAQTVVFVAWISINVLIPAWRWDYSQPYPLILLTLIISAQAAYAAPLILLNQNRQTDLDRIQTQRDRDEARQTETSTAYVIAELSTLRGAIDKAVTRDVLRQELGDLRSRLESLWTAVEDSPRSRRTDSKD